MTWKELTIIRILMFVAKMLADAELAKGLQDLSNHIAVTFRPSESAHDH